MYLIQVLSNLRLFLSEEEKRLLEADVEYRQRRLQMQQQQFHPTQDTAQNPPVPQDKCDNIKEMGDIQSGYANSSHSSHLDFHIKEEFSYFKVSNSRLAGRKGPNIFMRR